MPSLNPVIKPIIFTFLIMFISVSATTYMKDNIEKKAVQIREKRSMLSVMEKRGENILELKRGYPLIKDKLPKIEKALPDERNINELVNAVENAATRTNNAQVLSFEPLDNAQSAGTKIRSVKLSSTVSGNVGTFSAYLSALEELPYFIAIDSISIQNNSAAPNNGKMTLTAKVFISK